MKVASLDAPVRVSWLRDQDCRLDAPPFLSMAMLARVLARRLPPDRVTALQALTDPRNGGIYHAGREGRRWVTDPDRGIPFLGSTDILAADLTGLPLMSRDQVAANPLFRIHEGWTLVTRSGTIGRTAYCRSEMAGLACSEHVMRIVPDTTQIRSGYLFAWLSSVYGTALITGGTYGSIIQSIEPQHISALPVPRFDDALEAEIHERVHRAAHARTEAAALRARARSEVLVAVGLGGLAPLPPTTANAVFTVQLSDIRASMRLEASYHHPSGRRAADYLRDGSGDHRRLGSVARVFTPGIFKRPYVDDPEAGYPYFSGSELFQIDPAPRGFLSKRAAGINDYIVHRNWLLVQDAGQLGGLNGRVVRVADHWHGSVVSNHLMRIATESPTDAGFLFSLLSSRLGYLAITRNAFGSSIPQLDPAHIGDIVIPWPTSAGRVAIGKLVTRAWDLEDAARDDERSARRLVEDAFEAAT